MSRDTIPSVAFLIACTLSQAVNPSTVTTATITSTNSWNVRDLGAKGDGHTKDTVAVQKALDACATAGGGTVVVPAGNYLIGSIVLGSNTTLKCLGQARPISAVAQILMITHSCASAGRVSSRRGIGRWSRPRKPTSAIITGPVHPGSTDQH